MLIKYILGITTIYLNVNKVKTFETHEKKEIKFVFDDGSYEEINFISEEVRDEALEKIVDGMLNDHKFCDVT